MITRPWSDRTIGAKGALTPIAGHWLEKIFSSVILLISLTNIIADPLASKYQS